MSVNETINWPLLREQKLTLFHIIEGINDPDAVIFRGTAMSRRKATEALDGVVNLIDALQDEAVANGINEIEVFGESEDS